MDLFYALLKIVPKNLVSFLVGKMAEISWPRPLGRFLSKSFCFFMHVDMREAELSIEEYPSIASLFTRKLKQGTRPALASLVSPADGTLFLSGRADDGQALQVKGLTYSLEELVYGGENPYQPSGLAAYTTIYLAPHNYHRVHAPARGRLRGIRYFPGELWPVNPPFVRRVPRLFTRNERLVFDLETPDGFVHVVMVGALNVGKITTPLWPEFTAGSFSELLAGGPQTKFFAEDSCQIEACDELGTFHLGSTVVLAYDHSFVSANEVLQSEKDRPIIVGQPLLQNIKGN